ncbi:MAG: response regulator [Lewinellaceae bacterium]|nr:response regulator [Lewinella sp.]MCB9277973.1 response regulator [Lewinellaceae bacterium]
MHNHLPDVRLTSEVLLVEDDPAYARLVEIFLRNSEWVNCSLTILHNLRDTLDILEKRSFSAVLLDLSLPDSDGFETLSGLLSRFPNLNVIVLTGRSDHGLGLQTLKAGAQDFLVKGEFEADHIGKVLRYAIERNQITQRLEEAQRIGRMGHWQCYPAKRSFIASKEVFRIMDMPQDPLLYEHLEAGKCPLSFLNELKQEAVLNSESQKEISIVRPDGQELFIEALCRAEKLSDGNYFFYGIIQDITERRKAEAIRIERDLAEQAVKVREQILASVSHEMRTPMNAIVGMSKLMALTPLNEEQKNYLTAIEHSSEVLLHIINDILQAAALNHDGVKFEQEPFSMRELGQHLYRIISEKIGKKAIRLRFDISESVPEMLLGDKLRLYQILNNLLENAVKFTDSGEIIFRIAADPVKDNFVVLLFEIQDTGIGIPAESLDAIFTAFTRVARKDRIAEGTGLGLSICKALIERMGGSIRVSSALNSGSTFRFELPFAVIHPPARELIQEKDLTWIEPGRPFRVLVVEDHKINQLVSKFTLEKKWPQIEVILANDGLEALSFLENQTPDLVLMDLEMPNLNGFETTLRIRENLRLGPRDLPVIAMTAHVHVGQTEEYLKFGMNDYILKPFDPEELFKKIACYLNRYGHEKLPAH